MAGHISLRKTGVVVFAARIASIFSGLAFLVMMTHSLTAQQFGLYEVIVDLVTFAAYPAGLLAFWATRDIARNKMVGRTVVVLNLLLSLLGVGIYLALSYFSASRIPVAGFTTLLFAILLVPVAYLNQAANSIVAGHKPVVLGYAVIFSEVAKLAVAYPLLIVFRVGITGVILSVMVANLAQAIGSVALAGDAMSKPIDFAQGKRWLTHAWLPVLTTLPLMFGIADTYVASLAAADTTLVGHFQAAASVAALAGYSFYLASAMYPLLLKGGDYRITATTMDLALAFGIPMAVGVAVLAVPVLYLLNPQYVDASTALAVLAIAALGNTITSVFDQVLLGQDRVDVDESAKFRDYLRSSILFVAKVNLVTSAIYVGTVYASVAGGLAAGYSTATSLEIWALSQLMVFIISILIKARRIRKTEKALVPASIGYYAAGSAIMAVVLYLLQGLISYEVGTLFLTLELVAVGGTGAAVYAAFVLALDKPMRMFVRRAVRETIGQ